MKQIGGGFENQTETPKE